MTEYNTINGKDYCLADFKALKLRDRRRSRSSPITIRDDFSKLYSVSMVNLK